MVDTSREAVKYRVEELFEDIERFGTRVKMRELVDALLSRAEKAEAEREALAARLAEAEKEMAASRLAISHPHGEIGIGDTVEKISGYKWPGEVRAVFSTRAGQWRYVVECTVPEVDGALHIYNGSQIAARAWQEGK